MRRPMVQAALYAPLARGVRSGAPTPHGNLALFTRSCAGSLCRPISGASTRAGRPQAPSAFFPSGWIILFFGAWFLRQLASCLARSIVVWHERRLAPPPTPQDRMLYAIASASHVRGPSPWGAWPRQGEPRHLCFWRSASPVYVLIAMRYENGTVHTFVRDWAVACHAG